MKNLSKALGILGGAALLAGLVPTHFKKDEESGGFELGGLLWSLKKTPGEEKDDYALELLPFLGDGEEPEEDEDDWFEEAVDEAEAPAEAPAEEAPAEDAPAPTEPAPEV